MTEEKASSGRETNPRRLSESKNDGETVLNGDLSQSKKRLSGAATTQIATIMLMGTIISLQFLTESTRTRIFIIFGAVLLFLFGLPSILSHLKKMVSYFKRDNSV